MGLRCSHGAFLGRQTIKVFHFNNRAPICYKNQTDKNNTWALLQVRLSKALRDLLFVFFLKKKLVLSFLLINPQINTVYNTLIYLIGRTGDLSDNKIKQISRVQTKKSSEMMKSSLWDTQAALCSLLTKFYHLFFHLTIKILYKQKPNSYMIFCVPRLFVYQFLTKRNRFIDTFVRKVREKNSTFYLLQTELDFLYKTPDKKYR